MSNQWKVLNLRADLHTHVTYIYGMSYLNFVYRIIHRNVASVRQWPGSPRFNPRSSRTKDSNLMVKTQHYKVRIKCTWSNPGKGVALSPTSRCSNYWKRGLRVALDYGRQLYFIYNNDRSKSAKPHPDFRFVSNLSFLYCYNSAEIKTEIWICFVLVL